MRGFSRSTRVRMVDDVVLEQRRVVSDFYAGGQARHFLVKWCFFENRLVRGAIAVVDCFSKEEQDG